MASQKVALVPSNLARSPMLWTSQEVKAWLEFCVEEFSLSPVCVDKFGMNGKALCLLQRKDFMERAPHAGDVLHNAFQQLKTQEPAPSGQVMSPTPTNYVPILPHPYLGLPLPRLEDPTPVYIPESMLSPAPTEKYSSDSDSCHNERGQSPDAKDSPDNPRPPAARQLALPPSDGEYRLLWEFIYQLLQDDQYSALVCWDREAEHELTFRINKPTELADLWGMQKNRTNMTYEKLSRALRYYYKMKIIRKVQGKRLTYEFLQHPTKIRKGQRGARPHALKLMASIPPPTTVSPPLVGSAEGDHTTSLHPDHTPFQTGDSMFSLLGQAYLHREEGGENHEDPMLCENTTFSPRFSVQEPGSQYIGGGNTSSGHDHGLTYCTLRSAGCSDTNQIKRSVSEEDSRHSLSVPDESRAIPGVGTKISLSLSVESNRPHSLPIPAALHQQGSAVQEKIPSEDVPYGRAEASTWPPTCCPPSPVPYREASPSSHHCPRPCDTSSRRFSPYPNPPSPLAHHHHHHHHHTHLHHQKCLAPPLSQNLNTPRVYQLLQAPKSDGGHLDICDVKDRLCGRQLSRGEDDRHGESSTLHFKMESYAEQEEPQDLSMKKHM